MLAIVSAVLCVRSSFAIGSACFTDISNVDAQVSFATYYDNYYFLGSNGVPTGSDARVAFGAESDYGSRYGNHFFAIKRLMFLHHRQYYLFHLIWSF